MITYNFNEAKIGRPDSHCKTVFVRWQNCGVITRSTTFNLSNDTIRYKLQGGDSRPAKQESVCGCL